MFEKECEEVYTKDALLSWALDKGGSKLYHDIEDYIESFTDSDHYAMTQDGRLEFYDEFVFEGVKDILKNGGINVTTTASLDLHELHEVEELGPLY